MINTTDTLKQKGMNMKVVIQTRFDGEEPREVEAEYVPDTEQLFAVHRTTWPQADSDLFSNDAEEDGPEDWTVTHVASGYGIIHQLPARALAVDVATQLFQSYPALWFYTDADEIVKRTPKAIQNWVMNLRALVAINQTHAIPFNMIRTLAEYEKFKKPKVTSGSRSEATTKV
jgi:hypothetical protein